MIDFGTESGKVLRHALGLDPAETVAITIHWRAGEVPTARAELLLNERVVYEVIQLEPGERTRIPTRAVSGHLDASQQWLDSLSHAAGDAIDNLVENWGVDS
jgi:hypothetical protein